jgi:NADPH2:quinone reductase
MRAAYYEQNGPADAVLKVAEVETPKPQPGEVRVKLATSGVNPSDVKSRLGLTRKMAFPRVIPHSDGAGIIEAVGDGVSQSRIGERVWIWNGQWKRPYGTAAEFIVVPSAQAVRLPDKVSFEAGACLGIPAMTAFHAVELAGTTRETTLLVSGGAGSVSQYVIEFAKARGAKVLTTISSPEKAKIARDSGADQTINYKREDVGARVAELTDKRGVDAIIEMDIAANAKLIPSVLKPRGSVIIYGTGAMEATIPAQWCLVSSIRLQFFLVYELDATRRDHVVHGINRALEQGILSNRVADPFPLDKIVAAHQAVETGSATGNIVVSLAK